MAACFALFCAHVSLLLLDVFGDGMISRWRYLGMTLQMSRAVALLGFFWRSENKNGNFDHLLKVPLEAVSTLVLSIGSIFPFLVIFPKVWPLETSGLSISQSLDGQDHSENYYCRFKQTRLERDECLRLQGC